MQIFLKIETIPGDCQEENHKEWIELESISHGLSNMGQSMGSVGSGKAPTSLADHQDFSVAKVLDKSSPKLALACCQGDNVGTVKIDFVRSSGDKITFLNYELEKCHITSTSISASGGSDLPFENLSVAYDKIKWTYTELDPEGHKKGGDIMAHWDITARKGG